MVGVGILEFGVIEGLVRLVRVAQSYFIFVSILSSLAGLSSAYL